MSLLHKLFGRRDKTPPIAPARPAASPGEVATAQACRSRGNAALAEGRWADALAAYREAVRADPSDPLGHLNAGFVLLETGEAAAARDSLARAVALRRPTDDFLHEAQYLLGRAWEQLGEPARAEAEYRAAIGSHPAFPDPWQALAALQLAGGRPGEALESALQLVQLRPTSEAQLVLADAFSGTGQPTQAVSVLEAAVAADPLAVPAWQALGNALFGLGRHEEAAAAYSQVLSRAPDLVPAYVNRAVCRNRLGRVEDALADLQQALARDAGDRLALYNLPIVLIDHGRTDEAAEAAQAALAHFPQDADLQWNAAIALLTAGRWEQAWPWLESRWDATVLGTRPVRERFDVPRWRGQPLTGKTVLLHAEQGLGDTLQFVRYVPLLQARGARVLLFVPPALAALVATVSSECAVFTRRAEIPAFDYECPLMSVPLGVGTTLDTVPASVPYLRSDPDLRRTWEARLGPRKGVRIGLVWSGNAAHANDRLRSMALAQMLSMRVPGCQWVSLQRELRADDEQTLAAHPEVLHFGPELASFADTAALVDAMDLVISVDTSVAHLAGALGKPLWLLLSHKSDWRWMTGREDSPWYPSAWLCRQDRSRDWAPVLARVRERLQVLAADGAVAA